MVKLRIRTHLRAPTLGLGQKFPRRRLRLCGRSRTGCGFWGVELGPALVDGPDYLVEVAVDGCCVLDAGVLVARPGNGLADGDCGTDVVGLAHLERSRKEVEKGKKERVEEGDKGLSLRVLLGKSLAVVAGRSLWSLVIRFSL